jgi:hypothetical protein
MSILGLELEMFKGNLGELIKSKPSLRLFSLTMSESEIADFVLGSSFEGVER